MKNKLAATNKNDEKAYKKLFEAITAIKSPEEAKFFFRDLCTPAELQSMADRWLVVPFIMQGESYRSIFAKTGVSMTTIGRVARFVSHGNDGYNLIFERLRKKRVVKNK